MRVGQYRALQDQVRTGGAREIWEGMACVREPRGYRRLQPDHSLPHERESSLAVCLPEGATPHTVVNSSKPFPTLFSFLPKATTLEQPSSPRSGGSRWREKQENRLLSSVPTASQTDWVGKFSTEWSLKF